MNMFCNMPGISAWLWAPGITHFKWMTTILLWYSGMHGLHAGTPKKSNQIRFNAIHPLALNRMFASVFHLSALVANIWLLSKGRAVDERAVSSFPYTRWMFINDYQRESESFSAPLISRMFCVHVKLSLHQFLSSILNYTILDANWYADESRGPVLERVVFWFDLIRRQQPEGKGSRE